jgi:hypothetical protein
MLEQPGLLVRANDASLCEHLVAVKWLKTLPAERAVFQRRAGLYTSRLAVASLVGQPKTWRYVERMFTVNLSELAGASS